MKTMALPALYCVLSLFVEIEETNVISCILIYPESNYWYCCIGYLEISNLHNHDFSRHWQLAVMCPSLGLVSKCNFKGPTQATQAVMVALVHSGLHSASISPDPTIIRPAPWECSVSSSLSWSSWSSPGLLSSSASWQQPPHFSTSSRINWGICSIVKRQ